MAFMPSDRFPGLSINTPSRLLFLLPYATIACFIFTLRASMLKLNPIKAAISPLRGSTNSLNSFSKLPLSSPTTSYRYMASVATMSSVKPSDLPPRHLSTTYVSLHSLPFPCANYSY